MVLDPGPSDLVGGLVGARHQVAVLAAGEGHLDDDDDDEGLLACRGEVVEVSIREMT